MGNTSHCQKSTVSLKHTGKWDLPRVLKINLKKIKGEENERE